MTVISLQRPLRTWYFPSADIDDRCSCVLIHIDSAAVNDKNIYRCEHESPNLKLLRLAQGLSLVLTKIYLQDQSKAPMSFRAWREKVQKGARPLTDTPRILGPAQVLQVQQQNNTHSPIQSIFRWVDRD
jgi:hypothetical protein